MTSNVLTQQVKQLLAEHDIADIIAELHDELINEYDRLETADPDKADEIDEVIQHLDTLLNAVWTNEPDLQLVQGGADNA